MGAADPTLPPEREKEPVQFTGVIVLKWPNLAEHNSMIDPNTVFLFCHMAKTMGGRHMNLPDLS